MLRHIGELLEILDIVLCINLLCSRRFFFHIYDVFTIFFAMIVIECTNMWKLGQQYTWIGYSVFVLYVVAKFSLKLKNMVVNLILCTVIISILQLIGSFPAYLLEGKIPMDFLIALINVLVLIMLMIIGKNQRLFKMSNLIQESDWILKGVLLCAFMGVVYLIIVYKMTNYLRTTDYLVFGLWSVLLCITSVKWQKVKGENIAKERELEMRTAYDSIYADLLGTIKRKQHDFNNHINTVYSQHLIATSLEDLILRQRNYCKELIIDNRYSDLLSKGSPVIIGFLYSKFILAEENGCVVEYNVNVQELNCKIPLYKMIEVIGVLLDNAIEALEDVNNPKLDVEIIENQKEILVRIRNVSRYFTQEEINKFIQYGYSTKGKNRGIGLANVIKTLETYNSIMTVYNENKKHDNWFVFELKVEK